MKKVENFDDACKEYHAFQRTFSRCFEARAFLLYIYELLEKTAQAIDETLQEIL